MNYSSLNLINTCMQKADFLLNQRLQSPFESEAIVFGKAFHAALEHWYTLPEAERNLTDIEARAADTVMFNPPPEPLEGALESIRQFALVGDILRHLEGDKRDLSNALKILKAYFKLYAKDGWTVYSDSQGPCIERDFSFTLHETEAYQLEYFGRIDLILKQEHTGIIVVADHKTTASLGNQFYDRLKPNHQYTGYIMGAQSLGINTNLFMINGIQVAKTKTEFARQITPREEMDYMDLKAAAIETAERWLKAMELKRFPLNAPDPCGNYGACQFLEICRASSGLKNTLIRNMQEGFNA